MTSMKSAASTSPSTMNREAFRGIECEVGVVAADGVEETARLQSLGDAGPVLWGRYDERRILRQDGIGAEHRYRVEEKCVRP